MKQKDIKISGIITDEYSPMLEITVEGLLIRFSIQSVAPASREWLKDIIIRDFAYVYASAYKRAKEDIRAAHISFLESME